MLRLHGAFHPQGMPSTPTRWMLPCDWSHRTRVSAPHGHLPWRGSKARSKKLVAHIRRAGTPGRTRGHTQCRRWARAAARASTSGSMASSRPRRVIGRDLASLTACAEWTLCFVHDGTPCLDRRTSRQCLYAWSTRYPQGCVRPHAASAAPRRSAESNCAASFALISPRLSRSINLVALYAISASLGTASFCACLEAQLAMTFVVSCPQAPVRLPQLALHLFEVCRDLDKALDKVQAIIREFAERAGAYRRRSPSPQFVQLRRCIRDHRRNWELCQHLVHSFLLRTHDRPIICGHHTKNFGACQYFFGTNAGNHQNL